MNDTAHALYGLVWGTSPDNRRLAAMDLRAAVVDITETVTELLAAYITHTHGDGANLRHGLIDQAGASIRHLAGLACELNTSIEVRCVAPVPTEPDQEG